MGCLDLKDSLKSKTNHLSGKAKKELELESSFDMLQPNKQK